MVRELQSDEPKTTDLLIHRTVEMAAIFMIGDGMLGILQPERHVALWRSEVKAAALVRFFHGRPRLRRAYGVVQLAAGLALAASQKRRG